MTDPSAAAREAARSTDITGFTCLCRVRRAIEERDDAICSSHKAIARALDAFAAARVAEERERANKLARLAEVTLDFMRRRGLGEYADVLAPDLAALRVPGGEGTP